MSVFDFAFYLGGGTPTGKITIILICSLFFFLSISAPRAVFGP